MADQKPVVGIIMGSKSDLGVMEGCTAELEALGVPYELVIASAHRTPAKVHEWASTAADRGIKVMSLLLARLLTWAVSLLRLRRCRSSVCL